MLGSQILEVAVGLSLLYFLLALICSAVTEAIAGFTRLRARTLEQAIKGLIDDPTTLDAVLRHPAIADLAPLGGLPAYIPASNFAQAVLGSLSVVRALPADLTAALTQLPDGRFKRSMTAVAARAASEASGLQGSLEHWFDDAMARVSGTYKRLAQGIVIAAALGVTLLFNVDTLSVADGLWRSDELRSAVVAQAQKSVSGTIPAADLRTQAETLAALHLPVGWGREVGTPPVPGVSWLMRLSGWLLSVCALALGAPFWFDIMSRLVNVRLSGPKVASQGEPHQADQPDGSRPGAALPGAQLPAGLVGNPQVPVFALNKELP